MSLLLQHASISRAAAMPSTASTDRQTVFVSIGLPDDARDEVENAFGGNQTEQSSGVQNKPLEEHVTPPPSGVSHDRDDAVESKQHGSESGGKNRVIGPHPEMSEVGNIAQKQPVGHDTAQVDKEPPEADVYIAVEDDSNDKGSVKDASELQPSQDAVDHMAPEEANPESTSDAALGVAGNDDQEVVVIYIPEPSDSPSLVSEDSDGGLEELDASANPEPSFPANTDDGDPEVIVTFVTETPTTTPPTIIITEEDSAPNPGSMDVTSGLSETPQPEEEELLLDITVTPSVAPSSHTNSPGGEETIEEASPASSSGPFDDAIWAEIPMSVSNTADTFSPRTDASIRIFAANATETSQRNWKLVGLSEPNGDSIQRQKSISVLVVYHALLPREDAEERVLTLQEGVADGELDAYLQGTTDDEAVTVEMTEPPRLDVETIDEIVPGNSQVVSENGKGPESATGGADEANPAQDESNAESENKDNGKNFGIIIGSCLSGVAFVVVVLAVFVRFRKRGGDEGHLIDGVAGVPTTLTSLDSSETESSRYETGAPMHPRGPTVLRNQSRILDWQMDHAEVSGNAKHILGRTRRNNLRESEVARGETFNTSTEVSSAQVVD